MSEIYTHVCIKPGCTESYQSNEPDAYFCEAHLTEKQAIAKKIDAQFAHRYKEERRMSPLEIFDSQCLKLKTADGHTVSFLDARPRKQ